MQNRISRDGPYFSTYVSKKSRVRPYLLIAFLHLFVFTATFAYAMEDAIIAVVNDEIIAARDLHDYLDSVALQLKLDGKSPSYIQGIMADMKKNGLIRLVEDKLIISEANRLGMEVRKEAIEEKIETIKTQYSSEEDFLNALLTDGTTPTDLRNKVINQLKVKYLIQTEVRAKIQVNPREVTDYYKDHVDEFHKPERVNLDSIYISHSGNPAQAKEDALRAHALLEKGKNFADVADTYSQGPSIGVMSRGQMLPAIEQAVFKLSPGDVSPVLTVNNGFYIFRLNAKISASVASLEEVKEHIDNKLFQAKFRKRLRAWIDKLKKNAFVEIK